MHYNEFQAVKLARQLIEDDDEDDDGGDHIASASGDQSHETVASEGAVSVQHTGDTDAGNMLTEDLVWHARVKVSSVDESNCVSQNRTESDICRWTVACLQHSFSPQNAQAVLIICMYQIIHF